MIEPVAVSYPRLCRTGMRGWPGALYGRRVRRIGLCLLHTHNTCVIPCA